MTSMSDRIPPGRRTACLAAAALLPCLALAGCAAEPTTGSGPSWTQGERSPVFDPDRPVARPAGVSQTSHVRTAVLPLGAVPYDNLSLPLVSPSGAFIVTQSGFPPTWPTLRAEANAEPPIDTKLHVFMLEYSPGARPVLVASIEESVLLGRACNDNGFLVESPRSDGSRWIGLCDWSSGAIEWLVAGSNVNTFATLSRHGDLAWCRRAINDANFEIVVRTHNGAELTLATPGEDWLMPTWGEQRDRLFAFHLRGGELSATFHSLLSESALNRPLHQLPLAIEASVDTAFQSMVPHPATTALPRAGTDQLVFFHPAQARTTIWRPLEAAQRRLIIVPGDSISALVNDARWAIVTTSKDLVRQDLFMPENRQELIAGLLIARPTTSADWPYVLLSPSRPGQIGLTALNLLPVNER
jgi:hypothetical protein